ncbi:uncharacterized protein TrAtP1_002323 [Trichoderma atroviride]|uniref:uncharacterized protein n=1 Tax=Hypocrea atroviridis TaxID=63577 RepID=UPI00333251DA|nr:hypothetical protein TrAtP1_002323 [Trichoderma atroviride]
MLASPGCASADQQQISLSNCELRENTLKIWSLIFCWAERGMFEMERGLPGEWVSLKGLCGIGQCLQIGRRLRVC